MTAKKQQRKRTTRTLKRKKKSSKIVLSERFIGVLISLLSVFGIFHLGFLGTLIANIFRILIGDAYVVGLIIVLCIGIYLMIYGKEPQVKFRYLSSFTMILLGVLLSLDIFFFSGLNLHAKFVSTIWQYLKSDLWSSTVSSSVGGGLIGTICYAGIYFLLSQVGVYLISFILITSGMCILCGITPNQIITFLSKVIKKFFYIIKAIGGKLKNIIDQRQQTISKHKHFAVARQATVDEDCITEENKTSFSNTAPLTIPEDKDLPHPISESHEENKNLNSTKNEDQKEELGNAASWKNNLNEKENVPLAVHLSNSNYQLPPLSLLQDVPPTDQSEEQAAINRNQKVLMETLKSFGVKAELKNTILGPTVTKYELHPAIGVKVSKIVNLTDDLALALAAKDIRIEAPIPGKSLIGIEVPNKKVATISFKDVISAEQKRVHHLLEVPLGRDVSGNLITMNIVKTPHLLIAGATGSGKSVAINVILTSILMNCTPNEVKLILVDPKKVELGVYSGIPHLLSPVVTENKKAALSLNKLVSEMERRYEMFAKLGVRNIDGYNRALQKGNHEQSHMPYIVCVVDELADLMMISSSEVEGAIIRIAQMGRAAGIHMIIATQRPSVDVITGLIKANVPSRMAFAVSSGTDSRTILDQNGAEKLLGRGDMLFKMAGQKPIRVQGAYISDEDVENVVSFVKKEASVTYDDNFEITDEELQTNETTDDRDPLFNEVVDFIQVEQKVSISLLQRRFKIGYNRAARIVDDLTTQGIIGPQEGSKPRKVYLPKKEG